MHAKALEMCGLTNARIAGLMLGIAAAMTGGMASAFTFVDPYGSPCANLVLSAQGQVNCDNRPILTGCTGQIFIDAQGAVKCASSVPSAVSNVTAAAGNSQATVTFTAPSDGGSAITGYTVASSPTGGTDANAGSTALSHTITGLINGTEYTFTVTAANSVGTSQASIASNPVTPKSSQTVSFGNAPAIAAGGTGTVSATATSGLAVSFSSKTAGICTVSGSTVTGVAAGTCTIAADQPGSASYSAAAQVTQSFAISSGGGGGQTGVPVCSLVILPGYGNTIMLVANCTPAATSYTWSSNAGFAATDASGSLATPGPGTTYTVIGNNVSGSGAVASATYSASGGGGGGGGGGQTGVPVCSLVILPGYGNTIMLVANCAPAATSYTWSSNAGFAATDASGSLATPNTQTTYTVIGNNASGSSTLASVTYAVASAPVCTLTAAPPSIAPNGTSILTASCSPLASSYVWTGGACAGNTTATCTVTLAAGSQTYTVAGSNSTGAGNTASATVTVAPPACTLTAAPPSIAPNGTSTLTASCSPAAASYAWTGGTCAGNTTATCTVTLAAGSQIYNVTGTNAAGAGNTASATVTVAPPACTLTAAPSTIAPNTSSTLTASCSPVAASYA